MPATSASPERPRRKHRKAEGKALVRSRPLNSREKRYCQLIAAGWAARKAYQAATGCQNNETADVQAWRWNARPVVEAEVQRLRMQLTDATALHRSEKRHILGTIARDVAAPETARIQAIVVDNRMTGEDEPQRTVGAASVVVFTVDPIGEGTRGMRVAEGQETRALMPAAPAADSTGALEPGAAEKSAAETVLTAPIHEKKEGAP